MKKIIAFLIVVLIGINGFGQQVNRSASINETDYLQKSRNQKTAAWVLLGGGLAMAVTGMVIYENASQRSSFYCFR